MSFQHDEYFRESGQSIDYPQDANGQLVNAVKVHLWRLLQSRLIGFTGVGKLKPLNWTDYLSDRSLDQQEMLDEENQDDPWGLMDSSSETANELLVSEEEEMLEETGYYELYSFEKGVTKEICPLDHDLFWDDEDIFRDEPESILIYEDDN